MGPKELRVLRTSLGMSRTELANELGVSFETLVKWERGPEPGAARLNRIPEMAVRFLKVIEQRHLGKTRKAG